MNEIGINIHKIKQEIPDHTTLIVVSKTKPIEMLQAAYDAGQRDFGENKVQEMCEKQAQLSADIRWHLIGHLQTNKVKYIAPFVHLIHSVDSLKLLSEINKQAKKNNRIIPCLLQVFIATEETKFGLSKQEMIELLNDKNLPDLNNIKISGLMGMASNASNTAQIEREFESLKNLFDELKTQSFPHTDLQILSMGMSSDYAIAVKAGSTMIRVGSSIFGSR